MNSSKSISRNCNFWKEKILSINSNQIIIKGKSGIGKSTLLRSLKSYYGDTSILIDCNAFIFQGTIEENVLVGRKYNGKLENYLDILFPDECRFKNKETFVSNQTISSGQIQRIALLRDIIISENKIVLLDEPTSALDSAAEEKVSQLLEERSQHMGIKKLIIVTHSDSLEKYMKRAYIVNLSN